jgi:DNA polymerase-4
VGARAEERLHALGVCTIGELAALPENVLVHRFGKVGGHLWALAHGHDDRAVVPDRQAKSISTETTFERDIGDVEVLRVWLLDLVEHLATRLRRQELFVQTVELKVRTSDFETYSRARTLPEPTQRTDVLWQTAKALFDRTVTHALLPVRLLGVGASKLTRPGELQRDLFESEQHAKQGELDRTIDAIRGKFGEDAIRRGSLLGGDEGHGPYRAEE